MQESARSLRNKLRHDQAEDAYLDLLHSLAQGCFNQGWSADLAHQSLLQFCANLGASQGFIAKQQGNTLEVVASMGDSYPQAARIPLMGKIAIALKSPCTFKIHENLQAVTPHTSDTTSHTITLPIAFNSRVIGAIVLATNHATLTTQQHKLCETVSGLLGAIMHQQSAGQAAVADQSIIDVLTPREREVFALLPSGKSNAQLGQMLGIAAGTVKIHVERILSKLDLNDRTQAAVKAVELGYSSSERF